MIPMNKDYFTIFKIDKDSFRAKNNYQRWKWAYLDINIIFA